MRRLAPFLVSLVVLIAGCGTSTAPVVAWREGEPFWLDGGHVAVVGDGAIAVRFAAVIGDSRCPGGEIHCIWEGELNLEFGVTVPPAAEAGVQLNSVLEPRAAVIDGFRVVLLEAIGPLATGRPMLISRYRVRLVVDRVP